MTSIHPPLYIVHKHFCLIFYYVCSILVIKSYNRDIRLLLGYQHQKTLRISHIDTVQYGVSDHFFFYDEDKEEEELNEEQEDEEVDTKFRVPLSRRWFLSYDGRLSICLFLLRRVSFYCRG